MNLRPRSWKMFSSIGYLLSYLAIVTVVCGALIGGVWCNCVGFAAGDDARDALENAGYIDIQLHAPAKYKCSEKDTFSNTFTATNPRGSRVDGVVCCGWSAGCAGKACTIRF
jgi:hypothetical protein